METPSATSVSAGTAPIHRACLHMVKTVISVKVRRGVPTFKAKCVFCKTVLDGLSAEEMRP